MAIERDKFPIVFTIIENFGLSSSWTGNAIASANPENFYSLWDRNPHAVLYPNKINHTFSYENDDIDLSRIFSGREILSNKEYLDLAIETGEFKKNQIFNKVLNESLERNSAIHLIGNLPGSHDVNAEINHLLALLKAIEEKKIYRIYLHLILDDNLSEKVELIEKFISKISQFGSCEIASVVGRQYIDDNCKDNRAFAKAISTIVQGEGDRALSFEQALSLKKSVKPSHKKPTSVLFKNRYVCKFNNFDTVLFFNHNNKTFTKLLLALATGGGLSGRVNIPKFLKIVSFFNPFDQDMEQLEVLFEQRSKDTLAQSLYSKNIDQLFLSDTTRTSTIERHLKGQIKGNGGAIKELFVPTIKGSNPAFYNQVLDLMLEQVSTYLELKKARFITLLIPVLSTPSISTFAGMVEIVKLVDKFLPKLEDEVLKHNGVLILTSDHGGAEKMSERNNFELINSKTNNPVPLIVSIPGYRGFSENKIETGSHRILYDMIKKSHFVGDLAPTILDLVQAQVPAAMTGKSFLSELKVELKEEHHADKN